MSKYTTEVRFICEQKAGKTESVGLTGVDAVLAASWNKIFGSFPIWDEAYRPVLCQKILKHYYLREICCETVGVWELWLTERLNVIMPYYNELYKSTQFKYDPLITTDYTREGDRKGTATEDQSGTYKHSDKGTSKDDRSSTQTRKNTITTDATTTDTNNSTNRDLFSETPQGALTGVDNEEYLTNARKVTNTYTGDIVENRDVSDDGTTTQTDDYAGSTTSNRDSNTTNSKDAATTEDYLEHIKGKMGDSSYARLIMDYRASLINIDYQIIEELKDLFFGLW